MRALTDAGVLKNQIVVSPFCTVKDNHLFFSHRHDKGTTGRFGVITGIRKQKKPNPKKKVRLF